MSFSWPGMLPMAFLFLRPKTPFDIYKFFELAVQAYSACGPILSKIFTSTEIGTLGLSMNQPLLDENIVIYSTYLEESDKKFRILLENDRNSFDETFYIYDKKYLPD